MGELIKGRSEEGILGKGKEGGWKAISISFPNVKLRKGGVIGFRQFFTQYTHGFNANYI